MIDYGIYFDMLGKKLYSILRQNMNKELQNRKSGIMDIYSSSCGPPTHKSINIQKGDTQSYSS